LAAILRPTKVKKLPNYANQGFATLTYDSFAARGMTGLASRLGAGVIDSTVADAYAALRLLARHG